MALNAEDKSATFNPARCRKVEGRAVERIAEEMILRELRKARQRTQAHVALALNRQKNGILKNIY